MKLTMLKKIANQVCSTFSRQNVSIYESQSAQDVAEASLATVNLAKEGSGQFAAALPIQIPTGSGGALRTLTKISISSESSSSKNGTRRLLLRVSVPYFSLDPNAYASGARQLSTARSAKTMTAHIVVTVPREFEQDVKGMYTGDAGTIAAEAQLGGLLDLLRYCLGDVGSGLCASDLKVGLNVADQVYKGFGYKTPTILADDITGYTGQFGLILPETDQMTKKGSNPMIRSILGLSPLDDNDTVGLTAKVSNTPSYTFTPSGE